MLKPRRNRLEIFAEILRVCREGASKTQIVYSTNINFLVFREYREILMRAGLLQRNPDGRWKTTEKGQKYLTQFYGLITIGGL